ncbi:MAG: suppressor of fused domain protein [Peptococcaceae bacterium]|jgi:hypothetical protein|nr:suppressor of fused domain protein [Peptococcaceae bacterium]
MMQEEQFPELYEEEELEAIDEHIASCFGDYANVFHEIVSPDIHVDICLLEPTPERNYYTLITMGMGAHRMNVPTELAEYKLERAELLITLPPDWQVMDDAEVWYWPIRLLKTLARMPITCDTWLGWGHSVDNQEPFAENTELCGALLIDPQICGDEGDVCLLPNGEEVNFYQVLPLYRGEMDYKCDHNAEALLDAMAGVSYVVDIHRPSVVADKDKLQ